MRGRGETGEGQGETKIAGAGRSRLRCAAEGNFIAFDVKGEGPGIGPGVSREREEVGLRRLGRQHVAEAAAEEGAGPDRGCLEDLIKGVAGAAGLIGIA